ncbi:hypothetical protein MVES_001855 [Malassezia vespertilionis]|uniref:Uncharacterized protein n=1 Tax=Malassezia vespertilionis TaxID=2020962 RepID=A0A2N1JCN3_9BASI|nr:hypothetical protein MVES_001855 [Malassezia vespertilionis]
MPTVEWARDERRTVTLGVPRAEKPCGSLESTADGAPANDARNTHVLSAHTSAAPGPAFAAASAAGAGAGQPVFANATEGMKTHSDYAAWRDAAEWNSTWQVPQKSPEYYG